MINNNKLPGYIPAKSTVIVLLAGNLYQGDPEIICVWKGAATVVGVSNALKQIKTKYHYVMYAYITSCDEGAEPTEVEITMENKENAFKHVLSMSLEELKEIPEMRLHELKKYLENK